MLAAIRSKPTFGCLQVYLVFGGAGGFCATTMVSYVTCVFLMGGSISFRVIGAVIDFRVQYAMQCWCTASQTILVSAI